MNFKTSAVKGLKNEWTQRRLSVVYFLVIFSMNVIPRFLSIFSTTKNGYPDYLMTEPLSYLAVSITLILVTIAFMVSEWDYYSYGKAFSRVALWAIVFSIMGSFYSDVLFIARSTDLTQGYELFNQDVSHYLHQETWFYASLSVIGVTSIMLNVFMYSKNKTVKSVLEINESKEAFFKTFLIFYPLVLIIPLPLVNTLLFYKSRSPNFIDLAPLMSAIPMVVYSISIIGLTFYLLYQKERKKINVKDVKKWLMLLCVSTVVTLFYQAACLILPLKIMSDRKWMTPHQLVDQLWKQLEMNLISWLSLLGAVVFTLVLYRWVNSKTTKEQDEATETTGQFGTAEWADTQDLMKWDYLNQEKGILTGADDQGNALYLPLANKLTIAPQGLGKTTSSTIPVLLSHDGPVFVFDTKGELWAVTARYRSEVLGRQVVVLDPFRVTEGDDFKKDKPDSFFKRHTINPFDWIPENREQRHRMLNAFAASLVINEGGFATHFDENAKILIRGFIDYIMSFNREDRKLQMLYQLMCESADEAKTTFEQMVLLEGRAGAAANQINRVGVDEKGSILSTTYRQIDWMGDINIQQTLTESNFDLRDFLKGNMDIYVILPEDQVKEHARLFRMMMCLLMTLIVQANPSELPKKKMLFLLEELAQLGASPDVEQCIEVLRARGVVIWSVFQTLSQINMFNKPDLFKTKPIKQIFTNDDPETMEWVQKLGGDKTIRTKSISTNTGSSKQWMQFNRGSSSTGEGESIHETGVKLIQINEIRELPIDEQLLFLQGKKPVRCKKTRYFEHTHFVGRFDNNPLEMGERE